ncbi:DUF5330 domain-containing protein [Roseibium sp. SCP14]|uniref:DUF5330 domain-containing protein n=1 Tax=Roseibium sp. SCP14 TaxID=3141375 RepID=UPI00333D42CB
MFFLLRTAFWLTLVLVLIPLGSEQESPPNEAVDPVSAFLAAQAAVTDIGSFCERNPQACETGGDALSVIGSRARDGARIVYEFLDSQVAGKSDPDVLVTGSTPSPLPGATLVATSDTHSYNPVFKPASLVETVFGPVPRPKPRSG